MGARRRLLWLALKMDFLTILTLGIYRFWMKTRLRRWYWSAIRPGGHPLEYLGDPFEKLLGFLIAVVILAFYVGIVNLLLVFASFSLFQSNTAAYVASFIVVIPLWFYASYRARRYVLGRTRWRGIRLGVDPGAWGYAGRALVHWAVTLISLGLLWPRMTFMLEKYRAERSWYGTARIEQGGSWTMLYRAALPVLPVLAMLAIAALCFFTGNIGTAIGIAVLAGAAGIYAAVHYNVVSWKMLMDHKSAAGLGLRANPSPLRVFGIYIVGYITTSIVVAIPAALLTLPLLALQTSSTGGSMEFPFSVSAISALPEAVLIALTALCYFALFLLWGALRHAFVTMPLLRHYAETLTITGADALKGISQRARDEFSEAEGFAEALDLGAAI